MGVRFTPEANLELIPKPAFEANQLVSREATPKMTRNTEVLRGIFGKPQPNFVFRFAKFAARKELGFQKPYEVFNQLIKNSGVALEVRI